MSAKIAPKPFRVGLDLDGVLLYNPARIVRPIVKSFKRKYFGQKKTKFFIPKSPFEKWIWGIFHKSSMFIAPGIPLLETLVKNNLVEAYVITARFESLKKDTKKWVDKINQTGIIKDWIINDKNQQPHQYKYKTIKKLNLDYFIEDNLDIVSFLHQKEQENKISTKTLWISNYLDKKVAYPYKHPSFKSALTAMIYHIKSGKIRDLSNIHP